MPDIFDAIDVSTPTKENQDIFDRVELPTASPETGQPIEIGSPTGQELGAMVQDPETQRRLAAFGNAVKAQALGLLEPPPSDVQMSALPMDVGSRLKNAITGAAAYAYGLPPEQAAEIISPEYGLVRRARQAETPEEFFNAAVPLGTEALQYGALAAPLLKGFRATPRIIESGPPPVQTGPLMNIPQPYAPTEVPQNLAAAIARAQKTKIQQALEAQAQREVQPPLPTGTEGAAPQPVTGAEGEVWMPPETRFVVPPPQSEGLAWIQGSAAKEQPGVQYASPITSAGQVSQRQVRPPVGQTAPLRQPVGQPAGVQSPVRTQPSAAVPTTAEPWPPPAPQQVGEPIQVGSANRYVKAAEQRGELPAGTVQPGEGANVGQIIARGDTLLNRGADPYLAARRVAGQTGNAKSDDFAVMRSYYNRLAQNAAYARAQGDIGRIQSAEKAQADYYRDYYAPAKTEWAKAGVSMQDEVPLQAWDYNAMINQAIENVGRPLTNKERGTIRGASEMARRAETQANGAQQKWNEGLDKWSENDRKPAPSKAQIQKMFANFGDIVCG
jgi:hypothetical protein